MFVLCVLAGVSARQACASGAVAQEQMRKLQMQKAYQEAIAKKIAEERQKAMMVKAAYEMAAMRAVYQQALVRVTRQKMAEQTAKAVQYKKARAVAQYRAYQTALIKKKQTEQALAQAMARKIAAEKAVKTAVAKTAYEAALKKRAEEIAAYKLALQQKAVAQKQYQQAVQQKMITQKAVGEKVKREIAEGGYNSPWAAEDEADITDVWEELEASSYIWTDMIDLEPKLITVKRQIDLFQQDEVFIRKDPMHYVRFIDSMAQEQPDILEAPFADVLMVAAVIEYDFDNGQDQDAMALEILGQDGYAKNKERLEIQ